MNPLSDEIKEQRHQHYEVQEKYLRLMHTEIGRVWKIPDCCIRQFCNETVLGIPSALYREMRFHLPIPLGYQYVPCDKCMKKFYDEEQ